MVPCVALAQGTDCHFEWHEVRRTNNPAAPGARILRGRPPSRAPLNLTQILGHSLSIDRWEPAVLLRLFD